jgi:BCD family chlorophyll transporter-like MFS transporter
MMSILRTVARSFLGFVKVLRLSLPKIGVGWMFALLMVNFNQVAIYDLGVAAVIVTTMIGLHQLLSPFQVITGRIADRNPIFGLRRTPYMLLGATVASLVFLTLPSVATAMGSGSVLATITGFALLLVFGIGVSAMGDSHHSLIAEAVAPRLRGAVAGLAWTLMILSTIITAVVLQQMMPVYSQAAMQAVYNLTPFVVIGASLVGVLGIERRLRGAEIAAARERSRIAVPGANPLSAVLRVFNANPQVRMFFTFVFLSMLGIFLQDGILEVFGREVFAMEAGEASRFQQTWGGGVLLGMLLMGLLSVILPISKKLIATIGGVGSALGYGLLTLSALTTQQELLTPALLLMGVCTGFFNVGALSLMMDMTVDGATGLYMGLWGVAQAFGNGFAGILGGTLKSALVETGFLQAHLGYSVIFGLEAGLLLVGVAILRSVSIEEFRGLTRSDLTRTMEVATA